MQNLNTNLICGQNIYADRTRRHRIARRLVVTCYNSAKPPETSKCVRKHPKTYSFSAWGTNRNGLYDWDNNNFSAWVPPFFSSNMFSVKLMVSGQKSPGQKPPGQEPPGQIPPCQKPPGQKPPRENLWTQNIFYINKFLPWSCFILLDQSTYD